MASWTEADIERLKNRKPAAKQNGTQRMQALGRMKTGQMNKTEERFAQMLELERYAGRVKPHVIVNKYDRAWFSTAMREKDLEASLGTAYAGTVLDETKLAREAMPLALSWGR